MHVYSGSHSLNKSPLLLQFMLTLLMLQQCGVSLSWSYANRHNIICASSTLYCTLTDLCVDCTVRIHVCGLHSAYVCALALSYYA